MAKDVDELCRGAADGAVEAAYALLLDEGSYWRSRRTPPPFGAWEHWDIGQKDGLDPALLVTRVHP
jgi:hypothetical protein